VAKVTPAMPPGESATRRTGKGSRGTKSGTHGGGDEATASADPAPRSGGSKSKADDLFDEVFGTNGEKKSSDDGSKSKRTAYVPPAPGASNTEVPDRLPKGDIMSVVLANKPSIVRCVNEQKARDGNLHGTLVMHWTIQTSGKTSGINAVTDQFKSSYMATCLTGLVKSWNFPKHKYQPGEPVDFRSPWRGRRSERERRCARPPGATAVKGCAAGRAFRLKVGLSGQIPHRIRGLAPASRVS
jgi:hypothetical protein